MRSGRLANTNEAALVTVDADEGRVAGHFDRNTFFNVNGAGADINRFDNLRYALNLIASLGNTEPVVDSVTSQTLALPAMANLVGSTIDGQGSSPPLTYAWTKVSGPGTVYFSKGNQSTTGASFSKPGTYLLRLTVSDGDRISSSETSITVNDSFGAWSMRNNVADHCHSD